MADFRSAGNVPLGGAGEKQVKLYIFFILDTLFLTELDRQQTLALNKRKQIMCIDWKTIQLFQSQKCTVNYAASATIKDISWKTKSSAECLIACGCRKLHKASTPINHHYRILKQQGGINTCPLRKTRFITKWAGTERQPIYISTNAGEKTVISLSPPS